MLIYWQWALEIPIIHIIKRQNHLGDRRDWYNKDEGLNLIGVFCNYMAMDKSYNFSLRHNSVKRNYYYKKKYSYLEFLSVQERKLILGIQVIS